MSHWWLGQDWWHPYSTLWQQHGLGQDHVFLTFSFGFFRDGLPSLIHSQVTFSAFQPELIFILSVWTETKWEILTNTELGLVESVCAPVVSFHNRGWDRRMAWAWRSWTVAWELKWELIHIFYAFRGKQNACGLLPKWPGCAVNNFEQLRDNYSCAKCL